MRAVLLLATFSAFSFTANANITYSFSTSASYSGGTGTQTSTDCPVNDLCVSYADGIAAGTGDTLLLYLVYTPSATSNGTAVVSPGTTDNFGSLQAFCHDATTHTNSTACTNSVTIDGHLDITLHETLPTVSTGDFIDSLGGTFQGFSAGGGIANFTTTTFTIGNLQYSMQEPVGGYGINSLNGNATTLQGTVIDVTPAGTPEPASLAMIGGGLMALGWVARRKIS